MSERATPSIDTDLCTNCGACVVACRFEIIVSGDDAPSFDGPGMCLACGQCVAVCPPGALAHPDLASDSSLELAASPEVSSDDLMRFMARRRSIRSYEDRPVPPEVIERLLQAAVLAPSGHNAQNWAFSVITSPEKLDETRTSVVGTLRRLLGLARNPFGRIALRMAGMPVSREQAAGLSASLGRIIRAHAEGDDRLLWNAPALVIAHAPSSDITGAESCHYAVGNLMAMAVAEGLGTCLVGYVAEPAKRDRNLRRLLGVPDDHDLHAAALLGYPDITFARTVPKHEPTVTTI